MRSDVLRRLEKLESMSASWDHAHPGIWFHVNDQSAGGGGEPAPIVGWKLTASSFDVTTMRADGESDGDLRRRHFAACKEALPGVPVSVAIVADAE